MAQETCPRHGVAYSRRSYAKRTGGRGWTRICWKCTADNVNKSRAKAKALLDEIKSSRGCIKCGENHPACLQFHHRDPSKKSFNISIARANNGSMKRILAEIDKCDVMCANCHFKLHWRD